MALIADVADVIDNDEVDADVGRLVVELVDKLDDVVVGCCVLLKCVSGCRSVQLLKL